MSPESNAEIRRFSDIGPVRLDIQSDPELQTLQEAGYRPLCGIVFSEGKEFVVVGENNDASLKSVYGKFPEKTETEEGQVDKTYSEQVLNLDDCAHILVAQVGLPDIRLHASSSLHTFPSVRVDLGVVNTDTAEEEKIVLKEEEILNVFTDNSDSFLHAFSGASLENEEIALIVKRDLNGNGKVGLVFFIHPQESGFEYDSVTGMREFLKLLNQEFSDNGLPLQTKALQELKDQLKNKQIDFGGSDVREEIFRAQIIANVRLFERTKDEKYLQFLKKHLPGLFKSRVGRMFKASDQKEKISKAIDSVVSGQNKKPPALPDKRKTESSDEETNNYENKEWVTSQLKTEKAQAIWNEWKDEFDKYNNRGIGLRQILAHIVNFVYDSKTFDEFEDVKTLILAIEQSRIGRQTAPYSFYFSLSLDRSALFAKGRETGWSPIYIFCQEMRDYLLQKRLKLKESNFKSKMQ